MREAFGAVRYSVRQLQQSLECAFHLGLRLKSQKPERFLIRNPFDAFEGK